MNIVPKTSEWQPPERVSREETIARSDAVLAQARPAAARRPRTSSASTRSGSTGTWASRVYEPADAAQVARGADGKKIGIFLLHGGSGDYKSMEPMAQAVRREVRLQGRGDDLPRPALSRRSVARLAGRHHQSRRHRAHADLAHGRAHHARPVRGGARHHDAHALRHPHRRARQARHHLLRPHGGVAGGVRGRHEGRHAPALPGRRILDLPHRPFDRRADGVHDLAARAERRRHDRGRELAVRLHPGGAAQLVGRARQGRGPRARDHARRRRAPIRSTSSTSAPGATARAMPGRRRSARKGRRR